MKQKIWKALKAVVCGIAFIGSLQAEPRTWTSTSGSTIEALFLGEFGEDYWFEASSDGSFIKMPTKYISGEDLKLVADSEVEAVLPTSLCDKDPVSIHLLETIYTSQAAALSEEVETIREAIEQLIQPFQPTEKEAKEIEVSFTKRKYRKAGIPEELKEGTVMQVLEQLLEPHELSFQIREGGLKVGKF